MPETEHSPQEEQDTSAVTIPGWLIRPVLICAVLSLPTALAWFIRLELRNSSMDSRIAAVEASEIVRMTENMKTREDIAGIKTDVAVIRTVLENIQADRRAQREAAER